MENFYYDLLEKINSLSSGEELSKFIFSVPVLLEPQTIVVLDNIIAIENQFSNCKPFLNTLKVLTYEIQSGIINYPIGFGPLEVILERQLNGEISDNLAKQLAKQTETTKFLSSLYLKELSGFFLSKAQNGNWELALNAQELILSSIENFEFNENNNNIKYNIYWNFTEVIQIALVDVPDGRLYRKAKNICEMVIDEATKANDTLLRGDFLHKLGVLHLDPYTMRTSQNYDYQIKTWKKRLAQKLGQEISFIPEEELQMPEPLDALKIAENNLREAVNLREGNNKGLSIKALVQAMQWQNILGIDINEQELIGLCKDALKYLDANLYVYDRINILQSLAKFDSKTVIDEINKILNKSTDEYIKQIGHRKTYGLILTIASTLLRISPEKGLEILNANKYLFDNFADDDQRIAAFYSEFYLFREAYAYSFSAEEVNTHNTGQLIKLIENKANSEKWDIRKTSASLISAALYSTTKNEEGEGLVFLERAIRTALVFAHEHNDCLNFLTASLYIGEGTNNFNTGYWDKAVMCYTKALDYYIKIKLKTGVLDSLQRIKDVPLNDINISYYILSALAPYPIKLEKMFDSSFREIINDLCRNIIASFSNQGKSINPDLLLTSFQISKGQFFANLIRSGTINNFMLDSQSSSILSKIEELEAELSKSNNSISFQEALTKDEFLVSYINKSEKQSGSDLHGRLINLKNSFDDRVNNILLNTIESTKPVYFTLDYVQSCLSDSTVVLDYYIGMSGKGEASIFTLAITKEEVRASSAVIDFPYCKILMGNEEMGKINLNPFALTISGLRKNLLEEPGPYLVDEEAGKTLETDYIQYLGPFTEYLKKLSQSGKKHLCIIPHGPLHYYPFCLLGATGSPLAENWVVSYLPNIVLLDRQNQKRNNNAANTFKAIGCSFKSDNIFNLPVMPEVIREIENLSLIYGTDPIIDKQATTRNVINTLQNTRYVHISTHGQHDVIAPVFQCLYLNPDESSDGRLFAYELLSLDLGAVELLTLSACETALGRFDQFDNLRGLPANFMLAGVSNIIGTLWPVEIETSEFFFTTLYREINAGTSILDSFGLAQRETRYKFMQYRDWGAFYMIGA